MGCFTFRIALDVIESFLRRVVSLAFVAACTPRTDEQRLSWFALSSPNQTEGSRDDSIFEATWGQNPCNPIEERGACTRTPRHVTRTSPTGIATKENEIAW